MKKGYFTRIRKCRFEGNNYVGHLSHLYDCRVGRMSYFGSNCTFVSTNVGRFCSIAADVKIVAGEHPTHTWISTHPVFYAANCVTGISFTDENKFSEIKYADSEHRRVVIIGNDVWVGFGARILNGVHIGDGAIIATGAIVTKDVEPYSIVGGVPAKKIGQRFNDEEISFLLENKWWEKEFDWIRKNAFSFTDLKKYKEAFLKD